MRVVRKEPTSPFYKGIPYDYVTPGYTRTLFSLSLSSSYLLSFGQLNYTFPLSLNWRPHGQSRPTWKIIFLLSIGLLNWIQKSYEKNEKTFILFLQHFYIIINTVTWLWNLRKKETKYEYCVEAVGSCFTAWNKTMHLSLAYAIELVKTQTTNYLHKRTQALIRTHNLRTSFWHPINQPWHRAISIYHFSLKRKTIHLCW